MPNLLEAPPVPNRPGLIPWNHTTASEAGRRSGQVRRERAGLQPVTQPVHQPPDQVQTCINAQLRLVAEQVTRTRAVLNDDTSAWCEHCERGGIEPHHRAQLIKALDALLDRQRKLLGIPDPGSRRPAAEGKRAVASVAARGPWIPAVEVAPAPAALPTASSSMQPAKPLGWEYDDPSTDTPTDSVPPTA